MLTATWSHASWGSPRLAGSTAVGTPFPPRQLRKLRLLSGGLPTRPWPRPLPSQDPPEDGAPILTEDQSGIIEGKETSQERGWGKAVWKEEGQQLIDYTMLSEEVQGFLIVLGCQHAASSPANS